MCYHLAMKILRVVSDGHANSTKVFVDGQETQDLHVTRILLEGNELNRAWIETSRPEIDIVAEIDEGDPPVDCLLSLERKIDGLAADIEVRLAAVEDAIRVPSSPDAVGLIREVIKEARRRATQGSNQPLHFFVDQIEEAIRERA